jgi:para-nitrobenzyl esterase
MPGFRSFNLGVAFALALAGAALAQPPATDPTMVRIDDGSLRGAGVGGMISFKGIPYAAPPVGALRWRAPQPAKPWPGVLAADKFGPACMQTDNVPKSEDCLTLNVWRPAAAAGPLPVMVWIYGGALVHGRTSLYPADTLARQGVVVVSMNYRMGRFGFFAHPALAKEAPDDIRGNYGYMDQRAALQWVQRNIGSFGGDPKAVTIFGESAGGGSVMVHLTSPLSRGLFQRAILQSPGIPTARAKVIGLSELADAEKTAIDYAHAQGITSDGPAALKALRALPAGKLTEGASAPEEIAALAQGRLISGFAGPIRDGRLVVEAPEAALAAGRQAMVPVMIGANDRDLAVGTAGSKDELFKAFGADSAEARKRYDPRGDQTSEELKQQVFADRTLVEPARHLADEIARAGQPVWLYRFAYVSQAQRAKNMGTLHGFENSVHDEYPLGDGRRQGDAHRQGNGRPRQWLLGAVRFDRRPQRRRPAGMAAPRSRARPAAPLHQFRHRRRNRSAETAARFVAEGLEREPTDPGRGAGVEGRAGHPGQFHSSRDRSLFRQDREGRRLRRVAAPPGNGVDRQAGRGADEPRHALFLRRIRPRRRALDGHAARRGQALHVDAGGIAGSLHDRGRLCAWHLQLRQGQGRYALCLHHHPHAGRPREAGRRKGGQRAAGRHQGRAGQPRRVRSAELGSGVAGQGAERAERALQLARKQHGRCSAAKARSIRSRI